MMKPLSPEYLPLGINGLTLAISPQFSNAKLSTGDVSLNILRCFHYCPLDEGHCILEKR